MRCRQHRRGRSSSTFRAVDETECSHGLANGVIRVPATTAEVARLETLLAHPLGLEADSPRRIATGGTRVSRARPVRVQAERSLLRSRAGALQPALAVLAV